MPYPIDLTTLSNDDLLNGYSRAIDAAGIPNLDSFVFEYRKEIDRRLESADMIALIEFARVAESYFPSQDLPIRKKITYSPTGKKAPAWIGLFSRKNRGLAE